VIESRAGSRKHGCPFCSGKMVSLTNSLTRKDPELAEEWHPTKNGILTPAEITFGSNKKIWWACADHEWKSTVTDRTSGGNGCPFGSGYRASVTNSLVAKYPEIAAQWHPTKNGSLTPDEFFYTSSRKVWWRCPYNDDHEWRTAIPNRTTQNSGCPYCNLRPRPIQEIDLLFELTEFFEIGLDDRKLFEGGHVLDCDIIIRQERLIVEFDGSYWHR